MPKISVVIPTFNRADYLLEALDSVLNQTYHDFEIVVVDDGSTDNTKILLEEYSRINPDKTIRYFYQENQGPGAARNLGIKQAAGEYVAFLDSDDLWLPMKLEKQMKLFETDTETFLIFTDMQETENNLIRYKSHLAVKGHIDRILNGNSFLELIKENFIFTPTVLVFKNTFKKVGLFNTDYKIGEDYDMWLRIAKYFKASFINEPLVVRRIHSSNVTKNKILYLEEHVCFLSDFLKINMFNKNEKNIFSKQRIDNMYELGTQYFSKGEYKKSIKLFIKCIGSRNCLKSLSYLIVALFPSKLSDFLWRLKERLKKICQK